MYSLLRPMLFHLDPETAHHVTLRGLSALNSFGIEPHRRKAHT